jgi:hypothetical protein
MHGAVSPFPHTSSWRGAYLSTKYIFMVWYLFKHRDNFAILLDKLIVLRKSDIMSTGIAISLPTKMFLTQNKNYVL